MYVDIEAVSFKNLLLRTRSIIDQMDTSHPFITCATFKIRATSIESPSLPWITRSSVIGLMDEEFNETYQCEVYHPSYDIFLKKDEKVDYVIRMDNGDYHIKLLFGFASAQAQQKFENEIFLSMKIKLQDKENVPN